MSFLASEYHYHTLMLFFEDPIHPNHLIQFGIICLSLLIAWSAHQILRKGLIKGRQEKSSWRLGAHTLHRLTYPITALVCVQVGKVALKGHPIGLLKLCSLLLIALALIRLGIYIIQHVFPKTQLEHRTELFFSFFIWFSVTLHISGISHEVIDALDEISFSIGKQRLSLWLILSGVVLLAVSFVIALWLGRLVEQMLMGFETWDMSLKVVLAKLTRSLLLILAVLITLPLLGIDLTLLSVFGGALGVGLGFGLQKIASNYVSGFIILFDRSIRIGDVIQIETRTGQVTAITARYIVLQHVDGTEALVPNENLITSTVVNLSYTDQKILVKIPVQVSYSTNITETLALMLKQTEGVERIVQDPPPDALLAGFGSNGIDLMLTFWISDPEKGTLKLKSDVNLKIWKAFEEAGIEIPFPQQDVHLSGSLATEKSEVPRFRRRLNTKRHA